MTHFYKKKLFSSALVLSLFTFTSASAFDFVDLESEEKLITSGDPLDPKYANAGDNLRNGVGSIFVGFTELGGSGFLCTATAIDIRHIVTAAHCVTGESLTVSEIVFVLSAGLDEAEELDATGFAVHPFYPIFSPIVGAFSPGDIAVIELAEDLPAEIERYDLYRDTDEFDVPVQHYGYGTSGKGTRGDTGDSSFFYGRTGRNDYEQTLAPFFGDAIFDQLLYDFDSGGSKHNAMEWWFSPFRCGQENEDNAPWAQDGQCTTFKGGNYPDFKGHGKFEVGLAPGDSGGPGFIDGKIAGIHSFGLTHSCFGNSNGTDFTCGLDSSYGELSGDTRVSSYADWVDDVVIGIFPVTLIGATPSVVRSASASIGADFLTEGSRAFLDNTYSATMRAKID